MPKENIQYGTTKIEFTLEYTERKTLGIRVHPDNTVQVLAPMESPIEKVKEKIKSKASWIIKQQQYFISFHPITPPRKFVSGETHLYLGKQYRLKLIESKQEQVKLQGGKIIITIPSKEDKTRIKALLKNWYREKAIYHFQQLFQENIPIAQKFYKGTPTLKYRWMKMRWGSCNKEGEIHLNLELIKAPKKCIEYVIMHELCHLAHLNHSIAFYNLLEKVYPDWKTTKNKLERIMV